MPVSQKFFGNVAGVPVGSPDDQTEIGEYFPDGTSCQGYVRRGLASEMALDRMILPVREGREDGYLPSPPPDLTPMPWPMTPEQMRAHDLKRRSDQRDYIKECEEADRRIQRSFRITMGNVTGRFVGPPDRVR